MTPRIRVMVTASVLAAIALSGCTPVPVLAEEPIQCGTRNDIMALGSAAIRDLPTRPTASLQIRTSMPAVTTETCTAFLVHDGCAAFTAYHCLSNGAEYELTLGQEDGGAGVTVSSAAGEMELVASDQTLDYAIFSISKEIDFGSYDLSDAAPAAEAEIWIPWAWGVATKVVTAFESESACAQNRCRLASTATPVRYHCDTAPSASGAPVLSASTPHRVVALHSGDSGGACPNRGVAMNEILGDVPSSFPAGETRTVTEILDALECCGDGELTEVANPLSD